MKTQPKKRICQVTFTILCACFILSSGFSSVYILCQFHPEWWSVPEGGVFAGFVLAIIGIAGCFLGVVILSCLLLLMERVRSFCTEFCNTLIEQSLIFLVNLLVLDMTNLIPSQFVDACSSFQLIMSSTIGCGGKNDTEN